MNLADLRFITRKFFRFFSTFPLSFLAVSILFFDQPKTWAETERVTVDIPIYSESVLTSDLTSEAESLVESTINQRFQNPGITAVQVVVVANRNGEYLPILTTTVSRAQWQEKPTVRAWTSYFNASYALLQRHDDQGVVLANAALSANANSYSGPLQSQIQIDRALDEGRLTGPAAQQVLSDLD
jgi:hypothetical protein